MRAGTALGPRGGRRLPWQGRARDRELARLQGGGTDRNHVRPGAAKRTQRRLERLLHRIPISESADRHDGRNRHVGRHRHNDGRNGHNRDNGHNWGNGRNHNDGRNHPRRPEAAEVGLLLISKYVKPHSINVTGDYNHFALLASIEDLFAQSHLGYAATQGLLAFDASVYSAYK